MDVLLSAEMNIQGIFPAVLTPFRKDGALDLDRFARHVDRLYAAGVHGIYAGGNAGEWQALTQDERKAIAQTAVELSRGRGKTLIHIGSVRLGDAIDLARHAAEIGADAIGSLPPYAARYHLSEVRLWFERLGAATQLPFFVYYFPSLTGGVSGEAFFDALRPVAAITGYKFTDMNVFDMSVLMERGLTVLNGHDPHLKSALLMGAAGGIGSFYNVLAPEVMSLFRCCREGDVEKAEKYQAAINRMIRVVRRTRLIPALKFISKLQGCDLGSMREPALPLSAEEERILANEVKTIPCIA
jgi:N-acetylneuraminate lyase